MRNTLSMVFNLDIIENKDRCFRDLKHVFDITIINSVIKLMYIICTNVTLLYLLVYPGTSLAIPLFSMNKTRISFQNCAPSKQKQKNNNKYSWVSFPLEGKKLKTIMIDGRLMVKSAVSLEDNNERNKTPLSHDVVCV